MLRTALRLRQARRLGPSSSFRSNAKIRIHKRLLASHRSPLMNEASSSIHSQRLKPTAPKMRLAGSLVPIIILSFIIITMGGSLAYAADNARPGDFLFQVDRTIEQARIHLENDSQQIVRLHLQFADERLNEIIDLVQQGDITNLPSALTEYIQQIVATAPIIQMEQISGADISDLIIETSDSIDAHNKKLLDLIEEVPIEYKAAIRDAIDDAEEIRKVVVAPAPTKEPVVEVTPGAMVFEPEITPVKTKTSAQPTIPPTSAPHPPTNTPGSFTILPTETMPVAATSTPESPYPASPTPIIETGTVVFTQSVTKTPTKTSTPTPSPSATMTPTPHPSSTPAPTDTPNKGPTEATE
jgi:hypothetical protein